MLELWEELSIFIQEHNLNLASIVSDEIWLEKLAYLTDKLNNLNQLNLSLQKRDANIFPKPNF